MIYFFLILSFEIKIAGEVENMLKLRYQKKKMESAVANINDK